MLAGGIAGSQFRGRIANLRAEATFRGLHFAFDHRGIVADQRPRYVVTLDGDVVAVLQDGELEGRLEGITAGRRRLEVWPINGDVRRLPDFHGTGRGVPGRVTYGRQAFLKWPRSAATDTVKYSVYTDAGLGTVDYDTALLDEERVEIQPRWSEAADSGTGEGTLTAGGSWTGGTVNTSYHVEITGASTLRHDLAGSWSGDIPFLQNVPVFLPRGIVITMESPAAEYDAGDSWTIVVGPRNWGAVPGELAEGAHLFAVKAFDAAENASDPTDERRVRIIHGPNEVTGLAAVWNGTQIALTWALPADVDLAAVEVYSNASNLFARLQEDLIEDSPWRALASNATGYTFTPLLAGLWRFYVRTVDAAGRRSESVEVVEIDTTAPVGALNIPELVIATPIAGGSFGLSWQYAVAEGDTITKFLVYRHTDPEALAFTTPHAEVAWSPGADPVADVETTVGPEAVTVWYTVRAASETEETNNVDVVEAVPDAVAPDTPAELKGCAN